MEASPVQFPPTWGLDLGWARACLCPWDLALRRLHRSVGSSGTPGSGVRGGARVRQRDVCVQVPLEPHPRPQCHLLFSRHSAPTVSKNQPTFHSSVTSWGVSGGTARGRPGGHVAAVGVTFCPNAEARGLLPCACPCTLPHTWEAHLTLTLRPQPDCFLLLDTRVGKGLEGKGRSPGGEGHLGKGYRGHLVGVGRLGGGSRGSPGRGSSGRGRIAMELTPGERIGVRPREAGGDRSPLFLKK